MDRVVVTEDCQPNVWDKLGVAGAQTYRGTKKAGTAFRGHWWEYESMAQQQLLEAEELPAGHF